MFDVAIIAGGKGTRSANPGVPKSLQSVFGRPIIYNQLRELNLLLGQNPATVRIMSGFGSDKISEYVKSVEHEFKNLRITIVNESLPTGTLNPVINQAKLSSEKYSLVILGDLYLKFKTSSFMINVFNLMKQDPDIGFFVHPNKHPNQSDVVSMDPISCEVDEIFLKNRDLNATASNLAIAGIFLVKNEAIKHLKSIPGDFVESYCKGAVKNSFCLGLRTTDFIADAGTPERVHKIENFHQISTGEKNLFMNQSALFIDLDDTLILNQDIKVQFQAHMFNRNLIEIVSFCNSNAINVIVVTNQPGIAKGQFTAWQFQKFIQEFEVYISQFDIHIDDVFVCPHHPEQGWEGELRDLKINCDCRKPGSKLFEYAVIKHDIDLGKSLFLGDSQSDSEAAKRLGLKFLRYERNSFIDIISEVYSALQKRESAK